MAEAAPVYSDSDFSDEDQTPLDISFNQASTHVRKITTKLDNMQLLELYGLYKQSTDGKCNTPKPGWFDGRNRRKWEVWRSLEDMSKDEAKEKYISLVQKFDPGWSDVPDEQRGQKETWVAVSAMQHTPEPELVPNELSILDAARENCGERVAELLKQTPDLRHERDVDGLTALHWAADRDATKALRAALEGGIPIDSMDGCGQTALHYAASCGHIESTKILVNAGATLVKDDEDCTPVDLATDDEIKKILEGAKK